MRLPFHTLDVFTETRFAGNPLAVVLDAAELAPEAMQRVAREFNLSETVFVLPAADPANTAKLRIFTPMRELPFAGHPTVGTAALLAKIAAAEGKKPPRQSLRLEETVGLIRAEVGLGAGEAIQAEFEAPKLPERAGTPPAAELIAAALSLAPADIGFAGHRVSCYSAGNPFVFVPVASLDAVRRVQAQLQHWDAAFAGVAAAPYIYCRETDLPGSTFHARMLAPRFGIVEDPATGSAAAAFAAVVAAFDRPADGSHRILIEQGFEMGRASMIGLTVTMAAGRLTKVRIGGQTVPVSEGMITV
ncbi:MAG: PhzF family phenazine biosynthesis protein [Proteobacteria bacterium]|nr:PhzF family phenazine biosynthesis protein [Pseudomonadota bacterium]